MTIKLKLTHTFFKRSKSLANISISWSSISSSITVAKGIGYCVYWSGCKVGLVQERRCFLCLRNGRCEANFLELLMINFVDLTHFLLYQTPELIFAKKKRSDAKCLMHVFQILFIMQHEPLLRVCDLIGYEKYVKAPQNWVSFLTTH